MNKVLKEIEEAQRTKQIYIGDRLDGLILQLQELGPKPAPTTEAGELYLMVLADLKAFRECFPRRT